MSTAIPLESRIEAPEHQSLVVLENRLYNPKSILVVDDDAAVLRATSSVLASNGFDVATYDSAEGALLAYAARLASGASLPGIVLSDVIMPGVDGPAFHDEIWRMNSVQPFTYMSGYIGEHDTTRLGKWGLLGKPFSMDEILAHLRHQFEKQTGIYRIH